MRLLLPAVTEIKFVTFYLALIFPAKNRENSFPLLDFRGQKQSASQLSIMANMDSFSKCQDLPIKKKCFFFQFARDSLI